MKNFLGKKILFFTAHPDDESYLAAGTIYKNYKIGGENILLCSSLGEKGKTHLVKSMSEKSLKVLRKKELLDAAKVLKISKVYFLHFPDGGIKKYKRQLFNKALQLVNKIKPDLIVSFNLDGITGHLDHIAVGETAVKVSSKTKIVLIRFTLPTKFSKSAKKFLGSKKLNRRYASSVKYEKPKFKIVVDNKIKRRALACHKTQMTKNAYSGFPAYVSEELLKYEYFC